MKKFYKSSGQRREREREKNGEGVISKSSETIWSTLEHLVDGRHNFVRVGTNPWN